MYRIKVCKDENKQTYKWYSFATISEARMFMWICINNGYSASIFQI